jgi:hypothetical protein
MTLRFELQTGSIMAIPTWRLYADHRVAPLCRSYIGSIMPIAHTDNLYYGDDDENPQDGIRAVIAITDACYDMPDAEKHANACFIAAVNPQTLLALLDMVKEMREALEKLADPSLLPTTPP